jgi:hypothetical protein
MITNIDTDSGKITDEDRDRIRTGTQTLTGKRQRH